MFADGVSVLMLLMQAGVVAKYHGQVLLHILESTCSNTNISINIIVGLVFSQVVGMSLVRIHVILPLKHEWYATWLSTVDHGRWHTSFHGVCAAMRHVWQV